MFFIVCVAHTHSICPASQSAPESLEREATVCASGGTDFPSRMAALRYLSGSQPEGKELRHIFVLEYGIWSFRR